MMFMYCNTLLSCYCDCLTKIDIIVKILSGITVIVAFIIGIIRYSKGQKWKQYEFITNQIKDFKTDKFVQNVIMMLDYNKRYIELYHYKIDENKRKNETIVSYDDIILALKTDITETTKFSSEQVSIRDHFDVFLNYLEVYNSYIKNNIIHYEQIKPYLDYPLSNLFNNDKQNFTDAINQYISVYYANSLKELKEEFNKKQKNKKPIIEVQTDK